MVGRRSFLGGVAAISIGGAAVAVGPWAAASTRSTKPSSQGLSLTLVNHTDRYQNAEISFVIVGTELNDDAGTQVRVTPDGAMVPVSTSDNGPDGYADYAIPFASTGDTAISLPGDMSGRIYVSIGEALKFKVNEGNALAYPAGWVEADPNYEILHDCVEFTYLDGRMYCNTTMVDMFSVPLAIELTGEQSPSTGELVAGGRDQIFAGVGDQAEFAGLVVPDLRVIAPGHGIDAGLFDGAYFDSYIEEVWAKYQAESMTVTANDVTYTGQVSGDQFVFDGGVAPFSKPTTRDVFFCDGALSAPNDGITGPVAAVLGAGFNRSTLVEHTEQPTTDPADFYRTDVSNHYARVMHENTVDGKAYGFAFDDVGEFASYIEDNATAMTVTLTPF